MKFADVFFKGFKNGMKNFGNTISIIINFVLLSLVYIVGVGTTSIIAKITGKNFFEKKKINKNSYWCDLNLEKKPIDEYYRQF